MEATKGVGGRSKSSFWMGGESEANICRVYEKYQKVYIHDLTPSFIPPNNSIDYYMNTKMMHYYYHYSHFTDVKLGLREVMQVSHVAQPASSRADSVSSLSDSGPPFRPHVCCP